ncbi:MAG: glycosyltransferase family 9 protein, partial [Mailhella sp.]|nr:glycosyltransferase family 9 protein [Mailhella sp.]
MKNLIVQAQRLGDLVMTYPLFIWLKKQDDKEIFVLAEEKFYKELLHISPLVTYIPTDQMAYLKNFSYDTVINLSHREDTAKLVSTLDKNNFYGLEIENNCKKISGKWQLYRTSLTHNNHYNCLHWADLNALDCIAPAIMHSTKWKIPQGLQNGKIGLFVGASEEAKRPNIDFWAELAFQLCKKGYDPVFISGPSNEEKNIAYAAAKKAHIPHGVIA